MELTSQTVHLIGGIAFTALSLAMIFSIVSNFSSRSTDFGLAILFMLYGAESVFDLAIHGSAVPENYAMETFQHQIQGAILFFVGAAEMLRLFGIMKHRLWSFSVPVGLIGLGGIFLLHAQSGMDADAMMLMIAQHRAFGVVLVIAAAGYVLARFRLAENRAADLGWVASLLAFGLMLILYREGMAVM
tara:strand:+ start:9307 stop:9870 length:564 start_codon:yes stop_codon:yes gene_type:complete